MVTSQRPALAAYLAAFKPLCLVPVIGPADLQAGDAVAGLCAAILARRGDSFTNPVTWEAPALLPPIELAARAAAQFALGITPEEDGLHALGCGSATLRFDGVTAEHVSRTALRHGLRPDAPGAVRRLFADRPVRLDDDVMLLGQVFRARCTLRFARPGTSAALVAVQTLASRAGLRLRPAGAVRLRQADVLDLAATTMRLVAWRPALIDAGPLTPDTFRTINQMRPRQAARNFDPASEADLQVLSAWIDRQYARLAMS